MSSTAISYQGTLILDTKSKRTLHKNQGTHNLFQLLTRVLCAERYNPLDLPTYFLLFKCSPSTLVKHPDVNDHSTDLLVQTELKPSRETRVENDTLYTARYTATLDHNMLTSESFKVNSTDKLSLALVAGDHHTILAAVEFDMATFTIVAQGGQSNITWILTIANSDDIINDALLELLGG